MMTDPIIKLPSKIDLANYRYLTNIPETEKNLIDFIHIATLEEKYPELKS